MEENKNFEEDLLVDIPMRSSSPSIIKVIGVGGGGGNAVNHMYRQGIHDVNFVVCNTDMKALQDSPVPAKIQLGKEGLGAGNKPERARLAAEESVEDIRRMLSDGTKMVFITAGMGGGTGTGAAPVIAREAKNMDILTVGIVTIPFLFEGTRKIDQALDGVEDIAQYVDALLVINNERLREIYTELDLISAFAKADDTLSVAAKSIAEIITMHGKMNLDFQDVRTVLKDGGVAIMSSGFAEGPSRMTKAIEEALKSPLLNNSDIKNSKKVLLYFAFGKENGGESMQMEEINEVHEFMSQLDADVETKWGFEIDESLGKQVKVTILATGFSMSAIPGFKKREEDKKVEEQAISAALIEERNDRRDSFYGFTKGGGSSRPKPKYYIFKPADLGDEEIISLVEQTPTGVRSIEVLSEIRAKSDRHQAIEIDIPSPDNSGAGPIDFTM